ncbi:MAG: hypothetical protein IKH16_09280 [Selenomonadaceae bacterium]|nr:hypothetical protein [Selenomonadaceae bacterium]
MSSQTFPTTSEKPPTAQILCGIRGDNRNGESDKAGKSFFNTDGKFNIAEFFHFCSKLLIKEPKERGKAPAMIVFCAWQQIPMVQEYGKKHGFMNAYPLYFIKNNSSQALKANMKIVGAVENAMVLYRDRLPKFNNEGRMIFNWFQWRRDGNDIPNIHPTQKPVNLLKHLIRIFRADMGERHPTAGNDCGDRSPHEHRKIKSASKHQGNHIAGGRKRK